MRLHQILATCLSALALSLPLHADRIHFKASSANAVGNAKSYLEGKILEEDETHVRIRIHGGTMRIARIENDALSEEDIRKAEASARLRQNRREEAIADEIRVVIDFQGLFGNKVFRVQDPLLRKMDLWRIQQVVEDFLRSEILRLTGRQYL